MLTPLQSRRVVIAGASSLLGSELKSLLEESRFAACDFRLVDEAAAAGTLTEAGGEAAVIQPVEEDSFAKAWIIFFTGSPAFTKANLALAKGSGAHIVDLSGELAGQTDVFTWLPNVARISAHAQLGVYAIPAASSEIIARLTLALSTLHPAALSAVAFQPVSACGKSGIEELETQTGQLLSFQPVGKQVFDAQIAYTMLDRFGPASGPSLSTALETLRREVRASLPGHVTLPAVVLLHAPVYYGATVAACAVLPQHRDAAVLAKLCADGGFTPAGADNPPSNINSAGEITLQLSPPSQDSGNPSAWWFWAAADNLRVPASNALKLAEHLLG